MNNLMQIFVSLITSATAGWIAWRYETHRQERALQRRQQSVQSRTSPPGDQP